MAVGISGDASVRYFVRIFALLPPLRVSWCFAQRCSRIATRGSQRGATFPNCNLFRDDHAGTSTFLARFGKWDSGGGEGDPVASPFLTRACARRISLVVYR